MDAEVKTWYCKIGEAEVLQHPGDEIMRKAVTEAYKRVTGEEPVFIFSGWGAELTEAERAVVEDRLPEMPV